MEIIKIYALRDPFTHEVRYIGKTSKPLMERLEQHVYCAAWRGRKNGKTPKDKWIRRLARKGSAPVIEVIEVVTGDWQEREMYWINYYKNYGAQLTNGTLGGAGFKRK